ncbi:hypothetical protein PMI16_02536 [Herbaspirillum sp. CF444]|uniref:hypothetical protein n=1 Tax=Herbaspirillum sp. CF444 TaxID=1144319 RepID=UPI0002724BE1|nr:hypothetical protein [Herbaspirillum sp. CF444]EJL88356.1 hypothetical protein PMI16_02536 [Herbaspirillum sp. CF444]
MKAPLQPRASIQSAPTSQQSLSREDVAGFSDNRDSAAAHRTMAQQLAMSPRAQLQRKAQTVLRPASDSGAYQLKKVTPAKAAADAKAKYDTKDGNKGAVTNDWILTSEITAVDHEWGKLGAADPAGDNWNTGSSVSGGGANRPTQNLDLRVRRKNSHESHFIYHLPYFKDIHDLIAQVMEISKVNAGITHIAAFKSLNIANIRDAKIEEIAEYEPLSINLLTRLPLYDENKTDIEAAHPNFLADVEAKQLNPANADLATLKQNPQVINRYPGILAKKTAMQVQAKVGVLRTKLPPTRNQYAVGTEFAARQTADECIVVTRRGRTIAGVDTLLGAALCTEIDALIERHRQFGIQIQQYKTLLAQANTLAADVATRNNALPIAGAAAAAAAAAVKPLTIVEWNNYMERFKSLAASHKNIKTTIRTEEDAEILAVMKPLLTKIKLLQPAGKRNADEDDASAVGADEHARKVSRKNAADVKGEPPAAVAVVAAVAPVVGAAAAASAPAVTPN